MDAHRSLPELLADLKGIATISDSTVSLTDPKRYVDQTLDRLTWTAVFAEDADVRDSARWIIGATAPRLGVVPASIHTLYMAAGKGLVSGFTVPAINIRGLCYDMARAVIRTAKRHNSGTFIFEIARSEMGYCFLKPAEYTAVITAAACREGYRGPLFIQGDHFQTNAKKFKQNADQEVGLIKDLINEAIESGFYNIDIDTSTLVDLSFPTVDEQQRLNYETAADLSRYIRNLEPKGVTISIGGEIGEVGAKNSTVEELRAYLNGYRKALDRLKPGLAGISKMSVQTGTSHGGVPMADGTVAVVDVDFGTLEAISAAARKEYGLGGAVQHGASTLPAELFNRFPKVGTLEIHLATEFQNIILDHEAFPADLKGAIHEWVHKNCAEEAKPGQTEKQFLYKARKKAWGPFKKQTWSLPAATRDAISATLEAKFDFLFRSLNAVNTAGIAAQHVKPVEVPAAPPEALGAALKGQGTAGGRKAEVQKFEKDTDASELAD